MATVRIFKIAELLGTTSQEVTALLKRDHGIEVKSASSTIEEVVARQFVERLAKQRNITLPAAHMFAETPVVKGKKGSAPAKKAAEPAKPAAPMLPPPRLVKAAKVAAPVAEPEPVADEPEPVVEEAIEEASPAPVAGAGRSSSAPPAAHRDARPEDRRRRRRRRPTRTSSGQRRSSAPPAAPEPEPPVAAAPPPAAAAPPAPQARARPHRAADAAPAHRNRSSDHADRSRCRRRRRRARCSVRSRRPSRPHRWPRVPRARPPRPHPARVRADRRVRASPVSRARSIRARVRRWADRVRCPSQPVRPQQPGMPPRPGQPYPQRPGMPSRPSYQQRPGGAGRPAAAQRREHARPAPPPMASAPPPVTKTITLAEGMTVKDLADKLDLRVKDVLAKLLMKRLMLTINSALDTETATMIAREFGADVQMQSFEEELLQADEGESKAEDVIAARAGRHRHGPRRPRQDQPARRDPHDARRRARGGRDHAAHRRVSRHHQQARTSCSSTRRATRRSP